MSNFSHRYHKHAKLEQGELISLIITALIAGFYLSFNDWGDGAAKYDVGLQNLIFAIFAVLLILGTVVFLQKALGVFFGYKTSYKHSWPGLVVGFFVTVFSNGLFPFFLPGITNYKLIKVARLGKYLPHYKYSEMWVVSSLAVVIPLFFAAVFGSFYVASEVEIFRHITIAALLIAIFSLIPAPSLKNPLSENKGITDVKLYANIHQATFGYDLITFSFPAYVVLAATTAIFSLLVLVFQVFSIILSLVLALAVILVYRAAIIYLND